MVWGLFAYGLMAQGLIRISLVGFLAFVFGLSIQAFLFGCFFRNMSRPWAYVLYISCLWSGSEFLRNIAMGGFSFYISHAHAFCPLMLKLYGAVGCWGMSFFIFLVNSLIYVSFMHKQDRFYYGAAAGVIFLGVVMAGVVNRDSGTYLRSIRISVIQGNISPLEKMDPDLFDRHVILHLRLTEQAFVEFHPDLVIWPETAYPDDLLQSTQWLPVVKAQALHMHADLLLGIAPVIDGKEFNSALLISSRGEVSGLYHKQALVPFVEYAPLERWGIDWGRGYHITPGNKPGQFSLGPGLLPFGVVICSESAHPSLVQQLRQAGIRFLVEISNDGWFLDKPSCMLHAEAAVMRAVENHLWVIRAANTGFSFAVDPQGVIHQSRNLELGREGVGIFDIMISSHS